MIGRGNGSDPPDDRDDGGDAPERPTHPPPPSYSALRKSTVAPPADEPWDADDHAPIVVDEQPAEYDAETDGRVPERVLNDSDLEFLALGPDHTALLAAIDGERNLATVAAVAGLDGDRTRALLAWLLRRGVVRMRPTIE